MGIVGKLVQPDILDGHGVAGVEAAEDDAHGATT
jgi:hypothetical protein